MSRRAYGFMTFGTHMRRSFYSLACIRGLRRNGLAIQLVALTLDLYSHVTATMQEDAAAKIDAAFCAHPVRLGSNLGSGAIQNHLIIM